MRIRHKFLPHFSPGFVSSKIGLREGLGLLGFRLALWLELGVGTFSAQG